MLKKWSLIVLCDFVLALAVALVLVMTIEVSSHYGASAGLASMALLVLAMIVGAWLSISVPGFVSDFVIDDGRSALVSGAVYTLTAIVFSVVALTSLLPL